MAYKKLLLKFILIYYFRTILSNDPNKKVFLAKLGDHLKLNVTKSDAVRIEFGESVLRNWYDQGIKEYFVKTYSYKKGLFEIFNFTNDKAGLYLFNFRVTNNGTHKYEIITVTIVKADLTCGFTYPQPFIRKNDCHLAKDKITNAWCRLQISQNIINTSFPIGWKTADVDGGVMAARYINGSFVDAYVEGVDLEERESFECHASTITCSTSFHPESVFYARNKTARELTSYHIRPMTPSNKQQVPCYANISTHAECTYEWFHQDGGVVNKFLGETLQEKDLIKDGVYECLATCEYKDHKCVLLADRVEFSSHVTASSFSLSNLSYALLVVLLVLVTVGAWLVYKKVIRPRKNAEKDIKLLTKNNDETNNTTSPSNNNNITPTNNNNDNNTTTPPNTTNTTSTTTTVPITAPQHTTTTPNPIPTTAPHPTPTTIPHTPHISTNTTAWPAHKGTSRRSSFRRTSSNKSVMEKIHEEDSIEKRPSRITINDSRGSVVGVGLMRGRIYCVCSDRELLFVYHKDPPYNRLKPEEVALYGAKRPTDLVAQPASNSLFICDYSELQCVYRVHPREEGSKGVVVRCGVDGHPASIDVPHSHHAIIILKKNNMLKVEMYDISSHHPPSTEIKLQNIMTFDLSPCVKLPLKTSKVKDGRLCLLYASGNFNRKRFDGYHVMYLDPQTGKQVGGTFDFPSDFVPCSIVGDVERGGVWVLQQKSNAPLHHLGDQLCTPTSPIEWSGLRFCLNASHAIVACNNKSSTFLTIVPLSPVLRV